MYSIEFDAKTGVLEVVLSGFLATDEVDAYIADVERAFTKVKVRDYAALIDVSDCRIQSQETISRMAQHLAKLPKSRALAVVTGSPLARMQVRRIFNQSYMRIVSKKADGVAWVMSGIEPPADPA